MRFRESLSRLGINIIAEFKRASPSMGVINASADPAGRARQYEQGGAAAMSVLCDAERFSGSVEDLRKARAATGIPLLAKDFISAEERLREVREAGADEMPYGDVAPEDGGRHALGAHVDGKRHGAHHHERKEAQDNQESTAASVHRSTSRRRLKFGKNTQVSTALLARSSSTSPATAFWTR